ncbi:Phospholipid phosphatase 6 [Seminavis robusta]|uniref:Phospholipid phosphatase 6 n=1 Tax=Seminavis robusta TaxID=568900 RepID=A0A9N8H915_9STRA|nr:Phospholipid phosphatase 6 [Seminavis robusta]|eukprot:Sro259_g101440.1 Phospholipid phosphatase 6 (485) ;mRNA; r:61881-63335
MEKIVATVACMAKGMQAYLSRCESDLLERSNHEVLAFVVAVACVAYGTGMQGYWSASESDLVHFVVCLVGALIGYIALCALVKIVAVKQTEGNQLLSKEVAWMAWLQRGAGSRPEQNQPLNIRVASFCRHLVTDEAIFIGTPVLVWTFQERIMFLPFALNINEIANGLMKWCVQRPRPYWVEKDIINPIKKQELDYSFPSSHAQTSASFATTLFMEFGVNPITLTISFLCVVVCISRITLGVHYPTDVAAGVFLGVILTYGLEKADVLNQFIEDLDLQEQLKALAIFFALIPTAFGLIRHLFQQDSATLAKIQTKDVFRSGNNKVNVHQMDATIRSLDKYSFTLISLFGSGVGCVLMLQDNRNYTMQFPVSAMTLTEVMQSDFLWKRILLVGVPIMLSLFMMALVVPKKLTSNRGSNQATKFKCQILALSLKLIGSFLLGLWVMYGCPKCAWLLHWEDPLMACRHHHHRNQSLLVTGTIMSNKQ